MRTIFSWSRYLIWLAVISLLLATLAVFVFGLISTVSVIVETFRHGHYGAEGARVLSVEMIEMIDLFLLGTILFITAVGLQELFVDPGLKEILPEWMSVGSLDQLKFNLLAVIVVMLSILFLGVAASFELVEGESILDFGLATGLVIVAAAVAVYLFARVHHQSHESHESEEQVGAAHAELEGHGATDSGADLDIH
ncbi:MAG: YqhA family protein [Chloroflexota bacterium]|nr:YqhA family protein [Chloroflexota bacterium]